MNEKTWQHVCMEKKHYGDKKKKEITLYHLLPSQRILLGEISLRNFIQNLLSLLQQSVSGAFLNFFVELQVIIMNYKLEQSTLFPL